MASRLFSPGDLFPPPAELGQYLEADDQDRLFEEFWQELQHRFFKLETRQFYDEQGVPAFEAWRRGDHRQTERLVRARVFDEQADVYRFIETHNIEFVRIRILELPVSDYVRFENLVYRYAAEAGETVLGVESSRLPDDLRGSLFDFLLFDDSRVFVHDYDAEGLRRGSWLVTDRRVVDGYTKIAERLIGVAEPFKHLVDRHF